MKAIGYGVIQVSSGSAEGKWPMSIDTASEFADRLNVAAGRKNYAVVPVEHGAHFFPSPGPSPAADVAAAQAMIDADELA